jgi:DtxR family Mn-dependent transcriptional regulator
MIDAKIEEALEDLFAQKLDPSLQRRPVEQHTLMSAASLGLVILNDGIPSLTPKGNQIGEKILRRHRLAECLLRDILQVPDDEAEDDACKFEHLLRPGLEDRICTLLGHPQSCPHGRPIPRGSCCRNAETNQVQEVGALCDGRSGQTGVVAYLSTRDNREIQKLMAMGILPGSDIRLIRLFPSYIFAIGQSQFTVDHNLAEKIFVHWQD